MGRRFLTGEDVAVSIAAYEVRVGQCAQSLSDCRRVESLGHAVTEDPVAVGAPKIRDFAKYRVERNRVAVDVRKDG